MSLAHPWQGAGVVVATVVMVVEVPVLVVMVMVMVEVLLLVLILVWSGSDIGGGNHQGITKNAGFVKIMIWVRSTRFKFVSKALLHAAHCWYVAQNPCTGLDMSGSGSGK